MIIKGVVEEVIFSNAENGYSVILVDSNSDLVTAVGIFPPISNGESVELTGYWTENQRFGEQFCVDNVRIMQPTTCDAIRRYLSSGLFTGIGEATSLAIVNVFKEKTLEIIEKHPNELTKVKGVSLKKAMSLHEKFSSIKEMQDVIIFLQQYDVTLNLAIKIYKAYQSATKRIIQENPYRLVDDIQGVGFLTADKIAMKFGFQPDSKFRISAAISYVLFEISKKQGHTYFPRKNLVVEVNKLLNLDDVSSINEAIQLNMIQGKIQLFICENGEEGVMLTSFYMNELSIASKIATLRTNTYQSTMDAKIAVEKYQEINNIKFHEAQEKAIYNCLTGGVNVITGGPGTGKTTIVKCIVDVLLAQGLEVALCAPTGRAAKRLSQATGQDAKTIHRLLDLDFKDGKGEFLFNENCQLQEDVIIVDEVSMCDEYVFSALLKAIRPDARLIMVGDKDQLPSVGAGNVLADIIKSKYVPISYLSYIYRQEEDSKIVVNAHRINEGLMPLIDNKSKDFFFDNQSESKAILDNVLSMVTKRLPKFAKVNPLDIQVLCPMKKGLAGVENINKELQKVINPSRDSNEILKFKDSEFRVGDKVIHTVNNYNLEWRSELYNTAGVGVFNGEMGIIEQVNNKDISLLVRFDDGRRARYFRSDIDELNLAYAISIHKSQGSEFDVAVLAISGGNHFIMTKNLLYTGLTRAKKMAVIISSKDCIEKMVKNNFTLHRYTRLIEFIDQECVKRHVEKCIN